MTEVKYGHGKRFNRVPYISQERSISQIITDWPKNIVFSIQWIVDDNINKKKIKFIFATHFGP